MKRKILQLKDKKKQEGKTFIESSVRQALLSFMIKHANKFFVGKKKIHDLVQRDWYQMDDFQVKFLQRKQN